MFYMKACKYYESCGGRFGRECIICAKQNFPQAFADNIDDAQEKAWLSMYHLVQIYDESLPPAGRYLQLKGLCAPMP
jgi:hypothetical protein